MLSFPGGSKYDGEFQAGLYHGKGIKVWPSGASHDGEFRVGLYHGPGTQKDKHGKIAQQGVW